MDVPSIEGWTLQSSMVAAIEHPHAVGFTEDGQRLVAIDHDQTAWVAVLRGREITEVREDLTADDPDDETTFGYGTCDGRPVRYSSFDVQDLPLHAPGGWTLELRDAWKDSCALYLLGPDRAHRLVHLGAGWEDTFIGGFSPCGRYLAVRDFGCLMLRTRDAAFA